MDLIEHDGNHKTTITISLLFRGVVETRDSRSARRTTFGKANYRPKLHI